MRVFWFEFLLALRRLGRRRTQNGLLLLTLAVSLTLSLLSWTLFQTVHLSQPDFDPDGDYLVLGQAGATAVSFRSHWSREEMEAIRAAGDLFDDFAEVGFYNSLFIHTPRGEERFLGAYMSSHALQLTGAVPLKGRLFGPEDDKPGAPAVALISERMWETNFGRDPHIVGQTMTESGEVVTIVGVLPHTYRFPNDQDLWLGYGCTPNNWRVPLRDALVKLKPGVTRERVVRDIAVIQARLGPDSPANEYKQRPDLITLRDYYLLPQIRVSATILFALSLLFVLVSCANAANLMIVDFLGRRAEVAAGLALGIPRGAAMRGVCLQVGFVALLAAAISLALLPVAGPLLYERVKIINAPYWLAYHFHAHYVWIALGLAVLCAAVTVVAPLAYLWWVDPDRVIREHAYASRGTGRSFWRRVLLCAQIAVLTVLAVTAGLLVRSSYHVGEAQWGYPAGRIFLAKISNQSVEMKDWYNPERLKLHLRALDEIRARPETVAAALVGNPPGYSNGPYGTYGLDPGDFRDGHGLGEAYESEVTADYFKTLDVPFVHGETFPENPPVEAADAMAVINASLAERLWPGEDPIGRRLYARFTWMKPEQPPLSFVIRGVVRDFQANGPTARTNDAIFFPFTMKWGAGASVHFVVRDRTGVPPTRAIMDALHRTDSRITLYYPSTVKEQMYLMLSSLHMTTDLTTVFAVAALLLGAIGVYSLTVTQVMQSARDFGIRLALGGEPWRLWRRFARGHFVTALIGVIIGLAGATQVARVVGSLLFGVSSYGAETYATVAAAILAVAVLACVPSLFRLRRINPADCLRSL